MTMGDLLDRRNRCFGAGSPLFYHQPLTIVRGDGVYLFDEAGNRYVDLYNNVPCVGHCHPRVVEAVARQLGTLNVHSRYLHPAIVDYAERLTGLHHEGIESVVFSCTGSEANEVALAMARLATGGRGVITTDAAYHGNTAEISKLESPRQNPEARTIPFPDTYRLDIDGSARRHYLDHVAAAIDGLRRDGIPLAAMLICPICANEGLPEIPPGFLADAATMVREAGGLVIADEVQAGLGRTGHWWGYQIAGFEPDIVSMGKPLGNGVPLAATAASRDVVERFRRETDYFNTFASSPLQAAAGQAVLDVLEDEALAANALEVGTYLREQLRARQPGCTPMGDVRGCGLFVGLEWVTDRDSRSPDPDGAARVVEALKQRGFLAGNAGAFGNVVKIRPPLAFRRPHADAFLGAFDDALEAL